MRVLLGTGEIILNFDSRNVYINNRVINTSVPRFLSFKDFLLNTQLSFAEFGYL